MRSPKSATATAVRIKACSLRLTSRSCGIRVCASSKTHRLLCALRREPRLKTQHIPESIGAIATAGAMVSPKCERLCALKVSFVAQAFGREERFSPIPQRPTKPLANRDGEAGFRALDKRLRNMPIQNLAKGPLAFATADFHRQGQPPGDFRDAMIEIAERGSRGSLPSPRDQLSQECRLADM